MDQCTMVRRVRDTHVDDVKATTIKEKEKEKLKEKENQKYEEIFISQNLI